MSRISRLVVAVIATAFLCGVTGTALAGSGQSRLADQSTLLAMLEAEADQLRNRYTLGPRIGRVQKAELRKQVREIEEAADDLRAGRDVAASRLVELVGTQVYAEPIDRDDTQELAARLNSRQTVLDARLSQGPRIGAARRDRIKSELNALDDIIADLERGEEVDLARVDRIMGVQVARTPAEKRRMLEARKASMEFELYGMQRLGVLERKKIREEIESLDQQIERLERQQ